MCYILARKPTICIPLANVGSAFVKAVVGIINPSLVRAGTTLSCPLTLLYEARIYRVKVALWLSPYILGIIAAILRPTNSSFLYPNSILTVLFVWMTLPNYPSFPLIITTHVSAFYVYFPPASSIFEDYLIFFKIDYAFYKYFTL